MWWLLSVLTILNCLNLGLFENPSVVIIGAGPAGIAAATKLLENSINNITILEAENRIGGRVNTIQFNTGLIELGAEYCHGEKGNVVYEFAKDLLESSDSDIYSEINYSNGSKLDLEQLHEWRKFLIDYSNLTIEENYNTTGKSIGEVFIYHFNKTLLKKYENEAKILKVLKEALRTSEGFILGPEGAFSWFDTSYNSGFNECEGNQQLLWKKVGYKTIFEFLMKSYPDPNKKLPIDDKIRLNSAVKKINWNRNQSLTVETRDNRMYSADYVIFTPSVGVLKLYHQTLFNPQLPTSKQQAIEAIGIAGVMKVFLYFPNRWWSETDTIFPFLWSDEHFEVINTEFSHGPRKSGISWVSQIRVIVQNNNNPNVWVAWITGDLVPEIEKISDGTLKSGFQYVLNKFLAKRYNLTRIEGILKTNWYSNQNFLGTYSFDQTGFYQEGLSHRSKLFDPLIDVTGMSALLFAGEATNPTHFSTVHGAIETGYREAERIIKLQNKK